MNNLIAFSIRIATGLALTAVALGWQSCSKKPKSIQDTAPDAVYDEYARSKLFSVVATGDQPMIDDLEDGDLNGLKVDGRAWSWSQYDDLSDGDQLLTIRQLEDAPGSGNNVLYVRGGDWKNWGAGFSAYLVNRSNPRPFGCYDASVFKGIQFWIKIKGLDQSKVLIGTPETTSVDEGGLCLENCADNLEFAFEVTGEWQLIKAPFPEFILPGHDIVGLLDPTRIKGIHFAMETHGDYEIWLDEFSFFKD